MEKKCKILVIYHKPATLIKSEIFIPIQVGKDIMLEKSKDGKLSSKNRVWMEKNLIGDNTGDNISKLNRYFNEMSAIYWAWKHQIDIGNPEYIGFMHYRRHFIFSEQNYSKFTWLPKSKVYSYEFIDKKYEKMLDSKYVNNLINQYDIIASHTYNANNLDDGHWYRNCKERFAEVAKTSPKWYEMMEDIIYKNYPEYSNELKYLGNEPNHYLCNMFVMKKELFDKYCEFTFDVLFKIYNEFKFEKNDMWQTRAIGFLAEFLTSIFISAYKNKNSDKVKELDLTYVEEPDLRNPINKMMHFIFHKREYHDYKCITLLGNIKLKKRKKTNMFNCLRQQNEKIIKLLEDNKCGK